MHGGETDKERGCTDHLEVYVVIVYVYGRTFVRNFHELKTNRKTNSCWKTRYTNNANTDSSLQPRNVSGR